MPLRDYTEGKGRKRIREFAIEASSSVMSMTVGTLVEDRKERRGEENGLGSQKTKEGSREREREGRSDD